jgi:hypothetical protein
MAHQADKALTAAIAQVLRQARDGGMTTRDIADYFGGVADATISRWETGARAVSLDLLPTFDQLAGRPRGYTLRLAGYVTDDHDLRTAILTAPELDDEARKVLAGTYDVLLRLPPGDDVPVARQPAAKPPRGQRNPTRA